MIKMEGWVLIRGLANMVKNGLSISDIARQTGHDRKTIRKYLLTEEKPNYNTVSRPSKLDSYKDYIRIRVREVPEISNQRLLREIKEKGYTGSHSILDEFIMPLREDRQKEAVIRFETMPGEQSQVDWSFFGIIQDYGINKRLYCFSMVLGYSRVLYIEFTTSQDIFTFVRCHQNAFIYFGGYTCIILYDNLKTVVISRVEGNIAWNQKFMDFAGFYGFQPRLCRLYRAKTKGKVERPFEYIRRDFFIGTKFDGLEDLNQKAGHWLNTLANSRVHGTTKEIPFERLKQENLLPLKERFYDTSFVGVRKVSSDCFVSYEGNRYSVPYQYSRRSVTIRTDREQIRVYVAGQSEPISTHSLFKGKGKDISEPKHFEGIKVQQRERWQDFKESFLSLCPLAKDYWEGFLSSSQMRGRWWELRKILHFCQNHSVEDVECAFRRVLQYNAFGYKYIEGILKANRTGRESHISDILAGLLSKWGVPEVEKRQLEMYDSFANP